MRVKSCVPRPGRSSKRAAKKKKRKKRHAKPEHPLVSAVRARNTCICAPAKVCYGSLYTYICGCSSSPVFRSPRGRDRTSSRRPYLGPLINIEPQTQQLCIAVLHTHNARPGYALCTCNTCTPFDYDIDNKKKKRKKRTIDDMYWPIMQK
uniref:Uncharacterized protein n=1 Tax=Trichogramma kaykai TaxID=54128 RepID=A0ABD2XQI7_9HYME